MELLVYLLGKFVAYSAWCYFGLSLFNVDGTPPVGRALGLGAGRLLMGIAFGFVIAFAVSRPALAFPDDPVIPYLLAYVPVRVVEWSIMVMFLPGASSKSRAAYWVMGGVALSCAADIPLFAMTGGVRPNLGRIAC